MTNTSHVEERIDHLVKELAGKRRITSLGTNLSLLVGLISIALLCVYFGYGYFMLDELTRPETVVGSAKAYLDVGRSGEPGIHCQYADGSRTG